MGTLRWPGVAAVLLVVLALGASDASAQPAPESGSSDWRQVSAGGRHTCGIRTTGRLYCWGSDEWGQLGDGPGDSTSGTPVEVATGGSDWASVSAGQVHTCARKTTGLLLCWGNDLKGALGDGAGISHQSVPVEVFGGATNWASVSAGGLMTCGRKTTGRLYCWGYDEYGQLGNNAALVDQFVPVPVAGGATTWASVSTLGAHTCGRRTSGRLFCWGNDFYGMLGNGPGNSPSGTPVPVAGGATDWASVTVGGQFTCARKTTGRLFCWGSDQEGNFGDGPTDSSSFVPVPAVGGTAGWTSVSTGGQYTCGRKATGRLYCWGYNGSGAIAQDSTVLIAPSPVQVAGRASDWTAVDASTDYHTCARITTGRIFCWGLNDFGQLGNNDPGVTQYRPVLVWA